MFASRFIVFGATLLALAACSSAPSPTPPPITPPPNNQPTTNNQQPTTRRVLFLAGDHMPETGYPHSRVRDDGSKPESFSKLRSEVLERDLGLQVDELVLSANSRAGTSFDLAQLQSYAVVVLGSNGRLLSEAEASALMRYYTDGGSVLVYADFQYGPENWASDNAFLSKLGIEVFPDNFQPRTRITDVVSSHAIMQGVKEIEVEGISQFRFPAAVKDKFDIIAKCLPLARSGCALQPPEQAKVSAGDVVACVFAREDASAGVPPRALGRIAGVCDRNPFHNGPQKDGTELDKADNRALARNLFKWLARL